MRRMFAAMAVVVAILAGPAPSWAHHHRSPGREAGLAVAAATLNMVYVPAKLMTAGLGLAVGSFVGVLTGGSTRAAYAIWVPTATGTFLVTPSHVEGEEHIHFFGCDYADRPSTMAGSEAGSVYEAAYMTK